MPLDPHARRFLDLIAMGSAMGAGGEAGIEGKRRALANLSRLCRPRNLPEALTRDLDLPGPAGPLPARLYGPVGAEAQTLLPGLLFFHGGGLTAGDLDTHDTICRALAASGGLRVLSIAYRLAPEHPFPAALEDAAAALAHLRAEAAGLGIDPARIALGGESAGAGLAARLCQERGREGIAAQLLLCPVLDLAGTTPSRQDFAKGHYLDAGTVARDIAALGLTEAELADPRVSPLREPDLAGLPPTILHTAAFDMMRDEGAAYAGRLAEAGVPVRHTCHPGMIHAFYALGALVPASAAALACIGAELADLLQPQAAGGSPERHAA
ncbi:MULTISPECIES: alpha/beta hydrolase [Methylobacterium]|uniref:Acetyl esterase n=2 Tax=Pseudomonadota TaxID=1224 RepID=A0ABQ4SXD2_9HYPH|nr:MULTISPECIES: alpha/beta hydrolase [Methylobacterium]PIU06257.1 MAG: alpha/beta hydrolase [Methylobacterium sp. CG09_land_8_20_14_0_10_71_15]PIU14548.1 MAG: alpha/beta hydrolase [Methylobacterium sp. CG08_land_8_20_14_0_20_71_15]GBU18980.1 esterase [Methylobacterium sp.]GJE07522.1 Acetyl esterase [Methylobacterium jeotgali]